MLNPKGLFVTVDGPNGVGKTSVVAGVTKRLRELGREVLETLEPTNSELGKFIRQSESKYRGRTYACLIAADRYHHLHQEVIPALKKGEVVVSARYVESSLVLQRLDDVELDFIWELNSHVVIPDLSVILTATPEALTQRLQKRTSLSRFEVEESRAAELAYYLEAADFLSLRAFNIMVLDNETMTLEQNVARITKKVQSLLSNSPHGTSK